MQRELPLHEDVACAAGAGHVVPGQRTGPASQVQPKIAQSAIGVLIFRCEEAHAIEAEAVSVEDRTEPCRPASAGRFSLCQRIGLLPRQGGLDRRIDGRGLTGLKRPGSGRYSCTANRPRIRRPWSQR